MIIYIVQGSRDCLFASGVGTVFSITVSSWRSNTTVHSKLLDDNAATADRYSCSIGRLQMSRFEGAGLPG